MKYKKILLTGASGQLGQAISNSGYFENLLTPSREVLDITKTITIKKYFNNNDFAAVIHCAAMARMLECEQNPYKAIETNIIGTLRKEAKSKNKIRFLHISTDGVYSGTKGNYSEKDAAIPYNIYGWTKLGAECAVRMLTNYCIIRTSFFDPNKIKFDESATDAYSSKMQINDLVKAIAEMLESNFVGVINLGDIKKSDYERYKAFKPALKPCKLKDILKTVPFAMARDASLNTNLWKRVHKEK